MPSATRKPGPSFSAKRQQRGRIDRSAQFPVAASSEEVPAGYAKWLGELKHRIRRERLTITLASNSAMILLYWELGRGILEKQEREGWGARVVDRLAQDLRDAFPDMKGFSPRNLKYMRTFAASWRDREFVQRSVASLPWRHIIALLEKLKSPEERLWYATQAREYGWSRDILSVQIEAQAYLRQGRAQNNFPATLPPLDSDLAAQVFKDPYLFDFLGTDAPRREVELQRGLMDHLQSKIFGPAPKIARKKPTIAPPPAALWHGGGGAAEGRSHIGAYCPPQSMVMGFVIDIGGSIKAISSTLYCYPV